MHDHHSTHGTNGRATWLPVEFGRIPAELRALPQWVLWAFEPQRAGLKPTKIPYDPATLRRAKANDPTTWGAFDAARAAYSKDRQRWAGIGFEFATDGGLVGVDLDDCRDARTGDMAPWAIEAVERFRTYTEISPSGSGVKLWAKGRLPGDGAGIRRSYQAGVVEMYGRARFFAMTGHRLASAPAIINEGQSAIEWLWAAVGISCGERPADLLHLSAQSAVSALSAPLSLSAPSTLSFSVSSAPPEKSDDEVFSEAVEAVIRRSLPSGTKLRNRRVFHLARELKAIPSLADAPKNSGDLKKIVRKFHKLGRDCGVWQSPWEETWGDFMYAWPRVKFPAGREPIRLAFERAKAAAPPQAALEFERAEFKLLIALCRELQRTAGNDPFYLACRTAGALLGVPHTTAWRWLNTLCNCEILHVEEVGTLAAHKATRYRYIAPDGKA